MRDFAGNGVGPLLSAQALGPTVGVFAAAFDEQHRLLCVRQAYGARQWTNPGGRLENGEDPREGVLRELHEETGYHGVVTGFRGTYVAMYKKPTDIVLFFQVKLIGRDLWTPNDEISRCEFFAENELPQPMAYNSRVRMLDAFHTNESTLRVFSSPDPRPTAEEALQPNF